MVVEKGLLSEEKPSPVADPNVLQGETLQAAMARFNRSTSDVRASEQGGVVRIQSANLPPGIQAELNRAGYVPPVEGVLVWDAVFVKALGLLAGRESQGFGSSRILKTILQTMEIGVLCPDGRGQLASVSF